MVKYIYDMSKLLPGDIIMIRRPGEYLSDRIRTATDSEFSHAMLYVGDSSYIEASNKVVARNPARLLFDNPANTCVLRVKDEFLKQYTIIAAIYYARDVVGNPYSITDALRLERGCLDRFSEEMQICTRLVTKAYAVSGLKLVDNIEMCTPKQLQNSECVEVHRDFLRIANDLDLKFAASYDVTDDMVNAIFKLFDSLKPFGGGKIRKMSQLIQHVANHLEDDEAIAQLLVKSGYLKVLDTEEEKNTYNYDKEAFIQLYGDNAYEAAIDAMEVNLRGVARYDGDRMELIRLFVQGGMKSHTILELIALHQRIVEQCKRRIAVCREVMWDEQT